MNTSSKNVGTFTKEPNILTFETKFDMKWVKSEDFTVEVKKITIEPSHPNDPSVKLPFYTALRMYIHFKDAKIYEKFKQFNLTQKI